MSFLYPLRTSVTGMPIYIAHRPEQICALPAAAAAVDGINAPPNLSGSPPSMAFVTLMVLASPVLILLLRAAWITLSCYFLTPLRICRIMARQGVHGPPPRPLIGNLRDVSVLVAQATADDMPALSHDIVGRLMPHYVLWSRSYGESDMARM